ncbi:MAG TPA: RNA polymerase sigma factor, partial [Candidatus Dormibacteraeota bacterium]|nr:RNA polymerase sigma factor [Candidatus Dormibacteraeota bacterium]
LPPFHELLDAHARELHRFLLGVVGPEGADDCFQETWLAALRAYPRLAPGANHRAWLYTIARRKAIDHHRTRRPPALPPAPVVGEPVLGDARVWAAVRALPSRQLAAIVHRFVNDLPYREVGQRMGCSEAAARQSVRLGLRRLRQELAP